MKFDDEICKGISCPECSFNKGEDGCLLAQRLDEIEIIPEPCEDAVSRQAAISLPAKPREDRYFQTQSIDDAYDYGWYSLQECIEKLPSTQPDLSSYSDKLWRNAYERGRAKAMEEITRCKDCKWKQGAECVRFAEIRVFPNDFCSRAERREDG